MKKYKFLVLAMVLAMVCSTMLTLVACKRVDPKPPIDDDNSDIFEVDQTAINMQVKATSDTIKIDISTIDTSLSGEADIIAVKAYEYFKNDKFKGVSTNVVTEYNSKKIGTYKLGETKNISIDRFVESYDRLYDKYYAVQNDKILKGPIYATEIAAIKDVEPNFDIKSKKGVLGENIEHFKELDCSYAVLNFQMSSLFLFPTEREAGGEIQLVPPAGAIPFESNGKTYYFSPGVVNSWDEEVLKYYGDAKAHITAVVWAVNFDGLSSENFPLDMTYMPWAAQGTKLLSFNTSNKNGFEYYIAFMEFLASRYSDPASNLYIENFVIGNEVDYSGDYFRISENKAHLDTYMEEYSRLLRISNLAMKKYNERITINASFTHAWAKPGNTETEGRMDYAPKTMIEWLNFKSKLEGDYNWGIAPHCYGLSLGQPSVFYNDTVHAKEYGITNSIDTTAYLTFSNFELIEEYLNRDEMKYNGTVRNVWLTEAGVSSKLDKFKVEQAGCIATSWYKISQMDCVKAFAYYRMFDNAYEGELSFGLIDKNGNKKPSYKLWKYIDTQYSAVVANRDWLIGCGYKTPDGADHTSSNGDIKSYLDALDPFKTNWVKKQGGFNWKKAMPRTIEPVEELDGQILLEGITFDESKNDFVYDPEPIIFDSKSFIYDGQEKTIALNKDVLSNFTLEYVMRTKNDEGQNVDIVVDKCSATEIGKYIFFAKIKNGKTLVKQFRAELSIGNVTTDKSVYSLGERVYSQIKLSALPEGSSIVVTWGTQLGKYRWKYDIPETFDEDIITIDWYDFKNPEFLDDKKVPNCDFISGEYTVFLVTSDAKKTQLFKFEFA